uniref:ATP synthase complex subunit 8 n=1 Tax=Quasipaa exilispinosa TaxID=342815 RepID=A0A140STJ4_9NEOB|nr:ATP synthase F0 subunit 8 [Quasipaa exilispinosa]AGU46637.1 ATP synthase F0 subunit 8 [Quasipaa exilispinosa]QPO07314.1 ATP synthase F0 subunit 8 [Quasipaa exilispinosa]
MPQLLPSPWFFIFVFTWFIFISLAPQKILSHSFLNEPTLKFAKTTKHTWTWLW